VRIGLISDTHIPDAAKVIPPQVREVFKGVDLILHAGDLYSISVLDDLESIAPVLAALGDDDGDDVARDRRVLSMHALVLDGLTFWLTHARPSYDWNVELPDILVCGHSHAVAVLHSQGVLIVNPGSATFPRYQRELGTVALITINGGEVETRVVELRSMQEIKTSFDQFDQLITPEEAGFGGEPLI